MTTKRLINRIATGTMYTISFSGFAAVVVGLIWLVVTEAKKGVYVPLYIIGTAILFYASIVVASLMDERACK